MKLAGMDHIVTGRMVRGLIFKVALTLKLAVYMFMMEMYMLQGLG